MKHLGCTEVTALAEFSPSWFRLRVRDNGWGMAAEAEGRGLRNMASRIQEMGGTLTRHHRGGTELVFEAPLPLKPSAGLPQVPA